MEPAADEDEEEHTASVRYRGTRKRDIDFLQKSAKRNGVVQLASGLQYRVVKPGPEDGPRPGPNTPCKCHYRGLLTDGTVFDSSYERGQPLVLRPNQVVPGWTEALQLMREGDRWEIILPSHLGYGEGGAGPIPGGAVLIFELELLEVGAKDSAGSGQSLNFVLALVIIALGMLLFAYQQFTGAPAKPRGTVVSLDEASHPANPRVFFDVDIAGAPAGRVEFELFANVVPKTAENFRVLATGERGLGKSGKKLHFKDSVVHRIVPGFMCQGGDITSGNGRGGESIYGTTFDDEWEHGIVHHTEPGLLSMANRGPNSNGSQFFITVAATSWLDGKHVVFGRVVRGMEVVKAMEAVGTRSGSPTKEVRIVNSGQLSIDGQPMPVETS